MTLTAFLRSCVWSVPRRIFGKTPQSTHFSGTVEFCSHPHVHSFHSTAPDRKHDAGTSALTCTSSSQHATLSFTLCHGRSSTHSSTHIHKFPGIVRNYTQDRRASFGGSKSRFESHTLSKLFGPAYLWWGKVHPCRWRNTSSLFLAR